MANASNIRATYVVILLITDQFDISKLFFRNLEKLRPDIPAPTIAILVFFLLPYDPKGTCA